MRTWRWLGATALAIVLVAGIVVGEADAARRSTFTARVHGRVVRAKGRSVAAGYTADPTAALLVLGAAKLTRLHVGARIWQLGVACLTTDLAAAALPVTLTCSGNYTESRLGRPAETRGWTTDTGIRVTVTSFGGNRARGTMTGTFEQANATNPADPPVTLENGKFSVVFLLTGG